MRGTSRARRFAATTPSATSALRRRSANAAASAAAAAAAEESSLSPSSSSPPPPPPQPKNQKSVLFLSTVWPEPHSSAAGVRTTALLRSFAKAGYSLSVGASAARNAASEALERRPSSSPPSRKPVSCFSVPLNESAALDAALAASRPTDVVFDRFTSEEAFSWRVREKCPGAARVLDMQDCHALRRARARAVAEADGSGRSETAVVAALGAEIDASDRDAVREASAIYRSDLTLVCSPFEERLLISSMGPLGGGGDGSGKLVPAPLFASRRALSSRRRLKFEERKHFVAIGSFLHPPNVDSLLWLAGRRRSEEKRKKEKGRRTMMMKKTQSGESDENDGENLTPIWDLITAHPGMDGAELHVYGSYASKCAAAAEIHDPKRGVFVHGPASNLSPLSRARVLLAPLRYGAGLKGKIADAWMRGTPAVTTPIGGEGMMAVTMDDERGGGGGEKEVEVAAADGGRRRNEGSLPLLPWGGSCTSTTAISFASEAARLYLDEKAWVEASEEGLRLHDALYFDPTPADRAVAAVDALVSSGSSSPFSSSSSSLLRARREKDFVGSAMWADSARATEYFSRWIELKEKEKRKV